MAPGLPPAHAVALALWAVGATILIARARRRRRAAADSVAVAAAVEPAPPPPPAQVLTEQQPEGGPAAVSLSPPVDPRLASLRRKVSVASPQALGQGSNPPIPRPPYLDAALLEADNSLRERELSSASSSQTVLTPSSAASVARSLTGVAAGATRAAMTQHFARAGNAADIAAKEGSQETCTTLLGMLLGMAIVRFTDTYPIVRPHTPTHPHTTTACPMMHSHVHS